MTIHYISKRARVLGLVHKGSIILGETYVGNKSIIDFNVVIGYPIRTKILELRSRKIEISLEDLDNVSSGSIIKDNVIVRSGTVIYENVRIENNVEIGHNAFIRENTVIGENSRIGSYVVIEGDVKIGSNVNIQSLVYIPKMTIIEDNVFIGPNTVITNDKYPPSRRLSGVVIRRGVVIGANCTVIAGIEIGENSIIGAGSVVTKDIPPNSVVYGVPAKVMYDVETYLKKKRMYEEFLETS